MKACHPKFLVIICLLVKCNAENIAEANDINAGCYSGNGVKGDELSTAEDNMALIHKRITTYSGIDNFCEGYRDWDDPKSYAETIVKLCENEDITVQPVTSSEITKLISQLKKRKSGDVNGLTLEHLIYGGIALIDFLTTLIKNICYTKHVPDTIKKELLTPVHKKDKDPTIPSNYRGITCKVLEICVRARIEGTLNKQHNRLQKGFTKGASSINIGLLITEAINEAKDNNEKLILITLDAEKAFDVIDHILFWKLYHQGITGPTWLLIKELYRNTSTQVKSEECISQAFTNEQGVKHGVQFYKAYNKNIPDTLEATNIGFKIGTNYLGCPTCADDIMLCATSEQDASIQLRIIESCTKNDRVKINSKKTEILLINKKNTESNLELFNEKISEKTNHKASEY
ncbi:Hypothetical predicted protein [Mytilus galloprovincialis]|uniref:Reverse transcriptase domain-containing protein n=1 Tax=Mytilus galloprovincialis TaxID=29158 RepID=A0A8B6HJN8_MYTGA|nr:Hypothetical predicted protein [Mytilus galloprovincialis]